MRSTFLVLSFFRCHSLLMLFRVLFSFLRASVMPRHVTTSSLVVGRCPSMMDYWMTKVVMLSSPEAKGAVSMRLKFLCQEVAEMRANGWVGES